MCKELAQGCYLKAEQPGVGSQYVLTTLLVLVAQSVGCVCLPKQ